MFENQLDAIDPMEKTILKNYPACKPIAKERLERIETLRSREFVEDIGIRGQVIVTDYHSPDSVTLVTDEGESRRGGPAVDGPDDARRHQAGADLEDRARRRRQVHPSEPCGVLSALSGTLIAAGVTPPEGAEADTV